jgi:hypothetical protein
MSARETVLTYKHFPWGWFYFASPAPATSADIS